MEKYEVEINLHSISYEIEAENEEEAIAQAYELAMQETQYDLLKWANYEAKLWEG